MTRYVALLRGINVGGNRKLPMAELRTLASELGLDDPRTLIASGNLVFGADGGDEALSVRLERAIGARFGFTIDVIVRSAAEIDALAAANPFPAANPKSLHLCLTRRPPAADAATRIAERLLPREQVAQTAGAIWIDYGAGVAETKLTPGFLDRSAGSALTGRNWNTVQKLCAMLAA